MSKNANSGSPTSSKSSREDAEQIANVNANANATATATCETPVNKEPLTVIGTSLKLDVKMNDSQVSKMCRLCPSISGEVSLECLMLQDTTLECAPLHVQQMFHFDTSRLTPAEYLFILVYIVAVESGFATQKQCDKCWNDIVKISPACSYHSKNVLLLSRQTPRYTEDATKMHFSMHLRNIAKVSVEHSRLLDALLTVYVTGDFMIVTLIPDRSTALPGRSVCLSLARYVLSSQAKGKPLQQRFRKLKELDFLLREFLFVPVRNAQFTYYGVEMYPALLGLPNELSDSIFKYLNQNQLNILANVNHQLREDVHQSKYHKKRARISETVSRDCPSIETIAY